MGRESHLCLQIIAVFFEGFSWNKMQISKWLEKFLALKLEKFKFCSYLSLAVLLLLLKKYIAVSMEVFVQLFFAFFFYFLA